MSEPQVVALGEALVDLVPASHAEWTFVARPGGAPANVAVALARLGTPAAFVGRVGRDALGALVRGALAEAGVDLRGLQVDDTRLTPLALVVPGSGDVGRFLIYRSGTADTALEFGPDAAALVRSARVLHIGTLSLASERSREATCTAVDVARRHGTIVSCDVNLRASAWDDPHRMLREARALLPATDIVKVTSDELAALALDPAAILSDGPQLVLVTEGAAGATAFTERGAVHVPAPSVTAVDPTGAGDAFDAAFLQATLRSAERGADNIEDAVRAGVVAGALAVQVAGAMASYPSRAELDAALASVPSRAVAS